ncbi:MAG: SDR family NAD(P)-dependent oxidoreductase [Candidatus Limnocylindria bacterium]
MTPNHTDTERGVALVTGSGRNIGRAIALQLAADGHDIVVNVRQNRPEADAVAEAARALGVRAIVVVADVRDEQQVQRMFEEARAQLGPISILVNNAALRSERPIADLELEEWHRVTGIILDGAFLCARAAVAQMREAGGGRIVNIIGMSGQAGGSDRVHVVTAKAGLIGLTKALAVELGPDGITVNAVSPGMMDTVRDTSSATPEPKHHAMRVVPLERRGLPVEVATAVSFLASSGASYITGQTLNVNGGAYIA